MWDGMCKSNKESKWLIYFFVIIQTSEILKFAFIFLFLMSYQNGIANSNIATVTSTSQATFPWPRARACHTPW